MNSTRKIDPIPSSAAVPASDYIIIGGTGDLALRKIFPALFWRWLDGQVTEDFRLFVAARHAVPKEQFIASLRPFCAPCFDSGLADEEDWQSFAGILHMITLDVVSGEGADGLRAQLEQKPDAARPWIFYLAIAPSLFGESCTMLAKAGLIREQSRLVVEKPLGHDGASARAINDQLLAHFEEPQIYRIDHYLGKETVQNLMALRFANVIFETQWNNSHIDHIQITAAETVGVGQRADYYDKYGALRDMVQNHLLQLLCLVAMEPPAHFNADQVRDEKLRVLRALRPLQADEMLLGQYEGYTDELGKPSNTETWTALKISVDNWRWAGVPFYLRTGKNMAMRASEIVITFKNRPHDIFARSADAASEDQPNRLIIRVQPQEGLRLQLTSKAPGPGGMRLFPSELNLSFGETFEQRLPDAYERLLMDIARGNQTLFMRLDEVLAAWEFIDPIVGLAGQGQPTSYKIGSMGPPDDLLERDGRAWVKPHGPEA